MGGGEGGGADLRDNDFVSFDIYLVFFLLKIFSIQDISLLVLNPF